MSQASKRKEPGVISVGLITQAIAEEEEAELSRPGKAPLTTVAKPATALNEAVSLSLSFKHLLKIENLQLLTSLKRLRLDNNSITKIEGLEPCVHLEWLDLSFNKLKKIENLGHLTKLKDLSLYNNELTSVDGITDGVLATGPLQVLSLGNNLMVRLEDTIIKLRSLKNLEVLNMDGNPLCKPMEGQRCPYKVFVHGFLPKLKYLDYEMVTAAEKEAARDGGVPAEVLAEVEEMDSRAEKAEIRAQEKRDMIQSLANMNIEVAETLLDSILDEDPDFQKVVSMPGMPQLVQTIRETIKPASETLKVVGAEKDALIRAEIAQFQEAVNAITAESLATTSSILEDWEKRFKVAAKRATDAKHKHGGHFKQNKNAHDGKESDSEVSDILNDINALISDTVVFEASSIKTELETHENIEAILDTFETAMIELRGLKVANHETFYRAVESAAGTFTEIVQKHAEKVVADFASGKVHTDDEDLSTLLGDKESLYGALSQSHETRVAKILKSESDLKAREEKRCGGAVMDARRAELARNRGRIVEVKELKERCAARCKALLL